MQKHLKILLFHVKFSQTVEEEISIHLHVPKHSGDKTNVQHTDVRTHILGCAVIATCAVNISHTLYIVVGRS